MDMQLLTWAVTLHENPRDRCRRWNPRNGDCNESQAFSMYSLSATTQACFAWCMAWDEPNHLFEKDKSGLQHVGQARMKKLSAFFSFSHPRLALVKREQKNFLKEIFINKNSYYWKNITLDILWVSTFWSPQWHDIIRFRFKHTKVSHWKFYCHSYNISLVSFFSRYKTNLLYMDDDSGCKCKKYNLQD